jgi:2,3-bisphosphoglycerate-independent phosphoglycerate mutase
MEIAKQLIFIIFDRWGYREEREHNAIAQAHTPCFDRLWRQYPHALLEASGEAVGLPPGQIGGSEVGHLTIGAGKIIDNDFVRINKAAAAREFATNPAFKQLFAHVKKHDSTLQVLGMVSPGGVHSHQEHLHEFLRVAKQARITKVVIHAFTDGRDMEPQSAHKYLRELEQVIEDLGIGYIATATGRFYAMDRDTNWDRVAKAEAAIFAGQGTPAQTRKPSEFIAALHKQGVVDEHLEPVVFVDDNGRGYTIQKNDGVFLFNFRADRMRQIGKKISDRVNEDNLCFVTMTEYDQANRSLNCLVAFPQVDIETTLAQEISRAGLTQAHIAETEKYAHVTFFLNGAKEHQFPGEEYVLIDSRKDVRTHDLAPEMKAREIVDAALQRLDRGVQVVIINFANPDLVGHTGNFAATVTAIETVDRELSRLAAYAEKNSITMFITADHGNAEINVYKESGSKHTAHSINPVPAILTRKGAQLNNGTLADVAPTLLELLGIPKPAAMTGRSLLC